MHGYWNRILEIDLTSGAVGEINPGEAVYREYMGGAGVGAWLMARRAAADTDPLGPDNPLIFMTGPLTGAPLSGCTTRFDVQARSPLTRIWGESCCGGMLGVQMKRAGIDGIVITGASAKPVWLKIVDGAATLEDAGALWGRDTYETMETLRAAVKESDGRAPSVAAIGPAGENRVLFANIMNEDGNAAGRAGLGAVMGSKNLKAIAVLGTKKPEFADPEGLKAMAKDINERLGESIPVQSMKAFGTSGAMDLGSMTGDVPMKNWTLGEWDEGVAMINGPTMSDTILVKGHSCFGCAVGCKRVVKVEDGGLYDMPESAGPEYETVTGLGAMMLIDNLPAVAKMNELCNRMGMDTISAGGTMAFLCECVEKGLVSAADLDGIDLQWSAPDAVIELLKKTARRAGCGAWIADGSEGAAERIGGAAADCLTTVNRMEAPMHDPRGFHGQGLAYATSSRGACHVNAMEMFVEQGFAFYPELGLDEPYQGMESGGKAEMTAITQNLGAVLNAACVCHFPAIVFAEKDYVDALNLATGMGWTLETVMSAGERMWTLKRALNNMFGLTRANDRLPKRLLTPLDGGPSAGSAPDIDLMLSEYYKVRDIDERGRPSRAKLESLNLGFMAEKIHG